MGIGARKEASVSIKTQSAGTTFATRCTTFAGLNVKIPENETQKPNVNPSLVNNSVPKKRWNIVSTLSFTFPFRDLKCLLFELAGGDVQWLLEASSDLNSSTRHILLRRP